MGLQLLFDKTVNYWLLLDSPLMLTSVSLSVLRVEVYCVGSTYLPRRLERVSGIEAY